MDKTVDYDSEYPETSSLEQKPPCSVAVESWSEPIKVSDFVAKFAKNGFVDGSTLVYRRIGEVDRQATLESLMRLDDETMTSLKFTMDPKNLLCGDEEIDSTIMPETEEWASVNHRREDMKQSEPWRSRALRAVRTGAVKVDLKLPKFPEKESAETVKSCDIQGVEAVLIISYLLPSASGPYLKHMIGQFAVLGQTSLRSLVYRFKCEHDELRPGDFRDEPFARASVKPMKETLRGFALFIENVFYTNDWDYPHVIREWAALNNVGQYEVRSIDSVCFSEITVCLGKPYVYIHNGDCQHHVIINDLRMHSLLRDDCDVNHYPMLLESFVHRSVRTLCQLCGKRAAQWAVEDHPKLPLNPSFLCEGCNLHINYDNNVRKYDFKLFTYTDWGLM
ncbi:snRNA-activating protein complex subunit 3 [Galendromus occidentalis]|uniref:snRNA-activating protein complex subunit 3 n=1 Tax=Galendromus occidentalis TaxID=34638 RepID=A0AAJ7L807_9ACAR|nr:snRNA-activating protein complex subunit 3 [Galendromus occidentalis]